MVKQVQEGFKKSKEMYDQGRSDFYFEVQPNLTAEEAVSHTQRLAELKAEFSKPFSQKQTAAETSEIESQLSRFSNGSPIKVIKVWRNRPPEEYALGVESTGYQNKSHDSSHPVAGGYDFVLLSDKGYQPILMANPMQTILQYNPNVSGIESNYAKIYGHPAQMMNAMQHTNVSPQDMANSGLLGI